VFSSFLLAPGRKRRLHANKNHTTDPIGLITVCIYDSTGKTTHLLSVESSTFHRSKYYLYRKKQYFLRTHAFGCSAEALFCASAVIFKALPTICFSRQKIRSENKPESAKIRLNLGKNTLPFLFQVAYFMSKILWFCQV